MKKIPRRPLDPTFYQNNISVEIDGNALDTPARIIEYLRRKGFIQNGITNIQAAIEKDENLTLSFEDLGDNDAYITRIGGNSFKIVINSNHSKTRQRFSMAHEYAHYQLHRDTIGNKEIGERILYRNAYRDSKEYEANQAASEILMPEEDFRGRIMDCNGKIREIADSFQVSPEVVRIRAENLRYQINGK